MPTLDLTKTRWQFRDTTSKQPWLPATVPGCVHTDLLRAKRIPDPFYGTNDLGLQWIEECDWEYKTTFNATAALLVESEIELVADGLDTVATVYINGKKIATTDNMFIGHRWSVKPLLRSGANTLRVVFTSAMKYIRTTRTEFTPPVDCNDPVGGSVRIRKQPCQFGWDWGPRFVTAGIWRALRLEARSANRLAHVRVTQTHADSGRRVSLSLAPELARAKSVVLRHGESIRHKTLDLAKALATHGRDHIYLRIALDIDGVTVSEDTVFLAPPRFLDLPRAKKTAATVKLLTPIRASIAFTSPVFQHRFAFDLPGITHTASDNYFELYPREKKEVVVEFAKPVTKAILTAALHVKSLADTYA